MQYKLFQKRKYASQPSSYDCQAKCLIWKITRSEIFDYILNSNILNIFRNKDFRDGTTEVLVGLKGL